MNYLDHAATSPILPSVKKAMLDAMENLVGNASALHAPGHQAKIAIENAREEIAKLINAKPEEIIFTSGGSESNNMVMHTFAGHEIVTSPVEHPSILESAKLYRGTKKPKLISYMLANNELGTIFPVKEYCQKAHAEDAKFHTDATQALGKIPIDVKDLGIDYMTISAHKIGGPAGVGALYVKKGEKIKPLIVGGHQENNLRAGTYNTVGIVGFGAAIQYAQRYDTCTKYQRKIRPLRDYLAKQITQKIENAIINTDLENSLPNILNVSFLGAEGESTQLMLSEQGIYVATGSACASGKPSEVLLVTTNNPLVANSSIRFSLGLDFTKQDIDYIMQKLPMVIKKLRDISTYGDKK